MKINTEKIKFNVGDLIVDTSNTTSGLVIEILRSHIKVMWNEQTTKISKWELNRKIILKEFKYFPRKIVSRK